ncbi:Hypothetical predicted protein, partial [Marmota monax]
DLDGPLANRGDSRTPEGRGWEGHFKDTSDKLEDVAQQQKERGREKVTEDIAKDRSVTDMTVWSPCLWLLVLLLPFQQGDVVAVSAQRTGFEGDEHRGRGSPQLGVKELYNNDTLFSLKKKKTHTQMNREDLSSLW